MLWQDLRYGWRQLVQQPGFASAAVLTIALAIGANAAIFSFVSALLLRPLPFREPDRLVEISSVRGIERGKLMPREWDELNRDKSVFEGVAAWYPSQYNLTAGGVPEAVRSCQTTGNLFDVLGVRLTHGSSWPVEAFRARNPSVVLNYELWKNRLGGDPAIVGRTIVLDHAPYQVVGIAEPGFGFPVSSGLFRAANLGGAQNSDVRSLQAVARLKRGITVEQAQAHLDSFAGQQEQTYPDTNRGIRFRLVSLRTAYVGEVRPYLLLTLALVAVVLLIASANVVNLLLSRGLTRRKEMAVRAALGASRTRIVRQLLSESLLLTSIGSTAGLALAYWWMHLLREMLRVELPQWMHIELDGAVLLFTLMITVATGLAAGLAPALSASRPDLQESFRETSRGASMGRGQKGLGQALVAGELALAVILLVTAGLLVRSFRQLQQTDTGFNPERVLTFRTDPPWSRYNKVEQTALFYRQAVERLGALPGVESAAANHSLPLALNQNYGKPSVVVEGQGFHEQQQNPFVNVQIVSPNYLSMMGIGLLRGRSFDVGDRIGTSPVAVLGRPLSERLFGSQDPVGRRIRMVGLLGALEEKQESWFTVIGVAEGVRSESLLMPHGMDLYLSNQQQFAGDTFFLLRTRQDPATFRAAVAGAIRSVDPDQPIFEVQSLDKLISGTVWQRQAAGTLSVWFGALALVLSAVGAYSVLSWSVSQRTRELGIRQALGSTRWEVQRLVVGQGMKLAAYGLGIGAVVSAIVAIGISGLLYGVRPLDPLTFGTVLTVVLLVAVLACYVPARRASRIDPAVALRQE